MRTEAETRRDDALWLAPDDGAGHALPAVVSGGGGVEGAPSSSGAAGAGGGGGDARVDSALSAAAPSSPAAAAAMAESYFSRKSLMVKSGSGTGLLLAEELAVVDRALEANGLTRGDVTARAFGCLLEQARRHALEIVADAQDYAYHAARSDVQSSDLLLAAEMREDESGGGIAGAPSFSLSDALPHNPILSSAEELNRIPLPPIPPDCYNGAALPPAEEHRLTARTFDVTTSARVARRMGLGGPAPPAAVFGALASAGAGGAASTAGGGAGGVGGRAPGASGGDAAGGGVSAASSKAGGGTKRKRGSGTYGAGRGRQIPVKLKRPEGETAAAGGGETAVGAGVGGGVGGAAVLAHGSAVAAPGGTAAVQGSGVAAGPAAGAAGASRTATGTSSGAK